MIIMCSIVQQTGYDSNVLIVMKSDIVLNIVIRNNIIMKKTLLQKVEE